MDNYSKEILDEIKRLKIIKTKYFNLAKYLGTEHFIYGLNNSQKRMIAKVWMKNHKNIEFNDFIKFVSSLFRAESYEEKTIANLLIEYSHDFRKQIDPELIDKWLDSLGGWAEVDSLCQTNFRAEELLSKIDIWEKLIRRFAKDKNINKRRAALVLLTHPLAQSSDKKLADLAFEIVNKLKKEQSILITKAISWVLRSLIKNHRFRVINFLKENKDTLPKIAVREVGKKLATGKKN